MMMEYLLAALNVNSNVQIVIMVIIALRARVIKYCLQRRTANVHLDIICLIVQLVHMNANNAHQLQTTALNAIQELKGFYKQMKSITKVPVYAIRVIFLMDRVNNVRNVIILVNHVVPIVVAMNVRLIDNLIQMLYTVYA